MHEDISLNLPDGSVSSRQIDADVMCLYSGTPNYVSLTSKLLVCLSHCVTGVQTNSIDVLKLIALAIELGDTVC